MYCLRVFFTAASHGCDGSVELQPASLNIPQDTGFEAETGPEKTSP
jgi:hypothetical protein